MLTDIQVRGAKHPETGSYILSDGQGDGLQLEVYPTSKYWRLRYRRPYGGKNARLSLGKYPHVSLREARQLASDARSLLARGIDPGKVRQAEKKGIQGELTLKNFGRIQFDAVLREARKDPSQMRAILENDVYPIIGDKPLRHIEADDLRLVIFKKHRDGKPYAAAQIRNLLKRLFDHAIAQGFADRNPATLIQSKYIAVQKPRERALSPDEIKSFFNALDASDARRELKIALRLLLLTMTRKNELMRAKWEDINFDSAEWIIPQANSKTGKAHIVYMPPQVVDLFRELKWLAGNSPHVLPGLKGPNSFYADNVLNLLIKRVSPLDEAFTPHDFRRTASTILHETGFVSDVIEKALNHKLSGVRGVYNKAEYATQRRELLEWWADFIDTLCADSKKVTAGKFRRVG